MSIPQPELDERQMRENRAAGLRGCGHPLGTSRVCYECELASESKHPAKTAEQQAASNRAAGLRGCGHPLGTSRVCYDCEIADEKVRFGNRR